MSYWSQHRSSRIAVMFGSLAFGACVGACERWQPNYCPTARNQSCLELDAALPGACTVDQDCSGEMPVCDVIGSKTCVQCTTAESAACTGTTPVCSASNVCERCIAHLQCPLSNTCLPDGSCADPGKVAYVSPSGTDNTECSKGNPCTKVLKALATGRPYVKFHGTTDEGVSVSGGRVVTFLADPDAALTRRNGSGGGGDAIVTVQDNGTSLSIYDLTIRDAPNSPGGIGCVVPTASGAPSLALTRVKLINNPGGGISVAGGSLTVTQSTISGNQGGGLSVTGSPLTVTQSTISGNQGGGIFVTASPLTITQSTISENQGGGLTMSGAPMTFSIVNNFIYRNGNDVNASTGGLFLLPNGASKLEFNTIIDNKAKVATTSAGGVFCDEVGFTAAHNIIFRNTGGMTGNVQTVGSCLYGDSLNAPGSSNVDNSPGFVHPNAIPFDYHLSATSPRTVIDAAGACNGIDFDGEARPNGSACDLGADEFKPGGQ